MKEDIRRSLLKRRRSILEEELKQASEKINAYLINEIHGCSLKKILMYKSVDNEPDINRVIELAWKEGVEVYIPKVISGREIIINRFRKNSNMSINKYGIKESDDIETSQFHEIDAAILPLVGVDVNGFRLGYGGGYYDRFFNLRSEMTQKPFIIGAGYAFQILEISFAEDHDLKCDSVITEKGVFKF